MASPASVTVPGAPLGAGDPGASSLSGLLAGWARRTPGRLAFQDQAHREIWSGRPPITWSYAAADEMVSRLAGALRRLGLAPGSPIAISLPGGSEACLALLAVERAGLLPCLVPIAWDEAGTGAAIEAVQARAAIGQGVLADTRPAEVLCRVARDYFGLRFVAAFGPAVPDGVIDLDRVMLDADLGRDQAESRPGETSAGILTFSGGPDRAKAFQRAPEALAAAALSIIEAPPVGPGDRILTLLASDDLGALATGLATSLLTGATLESHGLFSAAALSRSLQRGPSTRLVAPAWMEDVLSAAGPLPVEGVTLVHRLPARFKAKGALKGPVTDVLALGELALLSARRESDGRSGLSLRDVPADEGEPLLQLRRDDDGALQVRGRAAAARPYGMDRQSGREHANEWRDSGLTAELFARYLTAVSER